MRDERTVAAKLEIEDVRDLNVDDAKKALVPPLELALVKDLDRNNGRVFHRAICRRERKRKTAPGEPMDALLLHSFQGTSRSLAPARRRRTARTRRVDRTERRNAHMSKLSFQYGLSVFLMTLVVYVCSPSTVMTAKGEGRLREAGDGEAKASGMRQPGGGLAGGEAYEG